MSATVRPSIAASPCHICFLPAQDELRTGVCTHSVCTPCICEWCARARADGIIRRLTRARPPPRTRALLRLKERAPTYAAVRSASFDGGLEAAARAFDDELFQCSVCRKPLADEARHRMLRDERLRARREEELSTALTFLAGAGVEPRCEQVAEGGGGPPPRCSSPQQAADECSVDTKPEGSLSDSESSAESWVLSDTHPCPRCAQQITGWDGGAHVTCPACALVFCAVCVQPTVPACGCYSLVDLELEELQSPPKPRPRSISTLSRRDFVARFQRCLVRAAACLRSKEGGDR